jgi:hypothetical protein
MISPLIQDQVVSCCIKEALTGLPNSAAANFDRLLVLAFLALLRTASHMI